VLIVVQTPARGDASAQARYPRALTRPTREGSGDLETEG